MRKKVIIAIICAIILVAAVFAVIALNGTGNKGMLSLGNSNNQNNNPSGGNNTANPGATNGTGLASLSPTPVTVKSGEANITLSLAYPGQGQEGSYSYTWDKAYDFHLVSTSNNGWKGKVVTKVFAEKSGEIGPKCLIVNYSDNKSVVWQLNAVQGNNMVNGNIDSWTTNGSDSHDENLSVIFNRTGDFNVTFQAFDAVTGKALSQPLNVGPLHVPVVGTLKVVTMNKGEYRTVGNATYFTIIVNITNDWNVRYDVNATNLVLFNNLTSAPADVSAMSFNGQSLAVGQSTQFTAYFNMIDMKGDSSTFQLEYIDPTSGQVIPVQIGGGAT